MCKNSENIKNFIEYLIKDKEISQLDDGELYEEFMLYPFMSRHVKKSITYRSLSQMVKAVCRKNHYGVELISKEGRRFYTYNFMHCNGRFEGEIKIQTRPTIVQN